MSSRLWLLVASAVLAVDGLGCAVAQSGGEQAVEGERVQAERRLDALRRSLEEGQAGADLSRAAPAQAPEDEPCFAIDDIDVDGARLLPAAVINGIAARYARSCMGRSAIKAFVAALDNAYAERGFITSRAYLPKQDLRSRRLTVQIVEGFVEKIVLERDGAVSDGFFDPLQLRAALPFGEGDFLNLRDVEQGLDQLSAPRSTNATVDLQPGEKPGGSALVIKTRTEDRFRGFVLLETEDRDLASLTRARLSLEADNLLNLSDSASGFLSGTEDSTSVGGSLRVPWGYWSFTASGSYSDEATRLTPTSDLVTLSANGFFEARNLLFRNARHKASVFGSLQYRRSERLINTTDLTPRKLTTLRGGVAHEYRGEGYVVFTELGMSGGAPLLGGDDDPDLLAPSAPRAEFLKYDGSVTYIRRLSDHLQFYSTAYAQTSNVAVLRSEEQLSIGGWSSVRGFEDAGFTGDLGGFARNEVSAAGLGSLFASPAEREAEQEAPGAVDGFWVSALDGLEPFVFVDVGYARSGTLKKGETLVGVGGGLRIDAAPFDLDAQLAFGVTDPRFERDESLQARVSLTWRVF